jgi:hypothetical protein
MPILGIMASQISGHLWAPEGAYDSLATVTVPSGGVASITFAGIPQGYKHLQLRTSMQTNRATYGTDDCYMRLNSDSGSNYANHGLYGDGSSAAAFGSASQTQVSIGKTGTGVINNFSGAVTDYLDYANTNKYKTVRTLSGADTNGLVAGYGGQIFLLSNLWMNTAAISTIYLYPVVGTQFNQYSTFALYGVK